MYTEKQKKEALSVYEKTGSVTETVRKLGYPAVQSLYKWIKTKDDPPRKRRKRKAINTKDHPLHPSAEFKLEILKRCFENG